MIIILDHFYALNYISNINHIFPLWKTPHFYVPDVEIPYIHHGFKGMDNYPPKVESQAEVPATSGGPWMGLQRWETRRFFCREHPHCIVRNCIWYIYIYIHVLTYIGSTKFNAEKCETRMVENNFLFSSIFMFPTFRHRTWGCYIYWSPRYSAWTSLLVSLLNWLRPGEFNGFMSSKGGHQAFGYD